MKSLLAIPVFNEERHLAAVLHRVRRCGMPVLFIDDGSTDRTPELLAEARNVHVITHPENRGYGKSISDAFCYARRNEFDWLITMDCDGQHEPAHIPRFLRAAAKDDADIISGTRYPDGFEDAQSAPRDRVEINRTITAMLNGRLGLPLTDAFCGFKAYRVAALDHISITVPGYAMPMQFWVQAARAELRIRELDVPLIYNDPNRHFGGQLDDPQIRLAHYLAVLESELGRGVLPDRPQTLQTCYFPACSIFRK
ncbi:MAG: glycosyltransferase family 2 protein [Planctomycetes bacterium]|nr:glycosyltransferase family 2 protein [Planctomycetota bacterium]MBI3832968.1 glycosyltransferase family 2 protein [Planctomycetota bacterium]